MNDNNDKAALITQLVEQNQAPLIGYLTKLLHDADLAADVAQDTFLAAYLAPVRDTGNLKSWLYTIATNRAIDELRKQRRRPPYVDISDYYDALPEEESDPQRCIPERLAQWEAMQRIAAPVREQFELYRQGYSIDDIAEREGVTPSGIKGRFARARMTFRAHYEEEAAA